MNLLLPIDSVNSYEFSDNKNTQVSDISSIDPKQMGLDIGPKTIRIFTNAILGVWDDNLEWSNGGF